MPIFHFNSRTDSIVLPDVEGEELPDVEAARAVAVASAREALEDHDMNYTRVLAIAAVIAAPMTMPAHAADTMSSLPANSWTITDYYKQDVYDQSKNTVGKIDDVLIDKSGKIEALIVGVGGFLGAGEKDVALPFSAVHAEKKDNKWYLTVNETKDSLKTAQGFKYNSSTTAWSPETK